MGSSRPPLSAPVRAESMRSCLATGANMPASWQARNIFAKHMNVDTKSRLICYDILDLGKQLQPIGMLVVLDSILNRITQNRAKGRNTFIFIDILRLYLYNLEHTAVYFSGGIQMENDKVLQSAEQKKRNADNETEIFDFFINVMVQIVEKYGKTVLRDLDCVA